jgi:hypothetical protein
MLSGQQEMEDNASCPHVGGLARSLSAQLFGRHVGRRTEQSWIGRDRRLIEELRQSQIKNHWLIPTSTPQSDVLRLEVSVNRLLIVEGDQALEQSNGE